MKLKSNVKNIKIKKRLNKMLITLMVSVVFCSQGLAISKAEEIEGHVIEESLTNDNIRADAESNEDFNFDGTVVRNIKKASDENNRFLSKYDPRGSGIMTSVKDQGRLGICWTFAGSATLETFLKKSGLGDFDLSEEHMRWWAKGGNFNWNIGDSEGSTNETPVGYFTSWMGPKLESDLPYNGSVLEEEGATKPSNFESAPKLDYQVLDVVNVATDIDSVKSAIVNYGAVMSGYYDDAKYMSDDRLAYYCDEPLGQTHAITIVGWNDDYSRDNFTGKAKPSKNGAWLIKNSWGDYNDEHGYMWMSYEDKTLLSFSDNYSISRVQKNKGQKIYQHEYSMSSSLTDSTITAANAFNFAQSEALQGVMFATDSDGANYEIYFIPEDGGLKYDKKILIKSGKVDHSGYTTVDIDDFPLPTGRGAIGVRIDNRINNKKSSIGLEKNVDNYKMFIAKANKGESYILVNGRLQDLNNIKEYSPSNVVIKGITKSFEGLNVLAGEDRYMTASKISENGWGSSENAVLVNGKAIADALTSTPLAKQKSAPILLTEKDSLSKASSDEIKRLGVKNVTIIGGENSISEKIVEELKSQGITVERISGEDRFETSLKIAQSISSNSSVESFALANGYTGLADAISFSPVSGSKNIPIILSKPDGSYRVPESFKEGIKSTYIIGGEKSVPSKVQSTLVNSTRVSGKDRYETNARIIDSFYKDSQLDSVFVSKDGITNPNMLIDGLAIGAYAAKIDSPIVLSSSKLTNEQRNVLSTKTIKNIVQVGKGNNSMAATELLIMKEKNK